jgi:hypothetical protein
VERPQEFNAELLAFLARVGETEPAAGTTVNDR